MVMHQAGHSRAQIMQEVHASTSRLIAECLMPACLTPYLPFDGQLIAGAGQTQPR